jgi:hypothetical protein
MSVGRKGRVAVVWRGSRGPNEGERYASVCEALRAVAIEPVPVPYDEDGADIPDVDGALVWIDPLRDGKTRRNIDARLRELAREGVWIGSHPDVIAKLGTKEVLFTTRHLGWGSDVALYRDEVELRSAFPSRLAAGARVLKPNRGNGGQGIWKVERASGHVVVIEAVPGASAETMTLDAFLGRMTPALAHGPIVDQAFLPSAVDGMIRCYVVRDHVVGFGTQNVAALLEGQQKGPRIMHPPDAPELAALRTLMEAEWVQGAMSALAIERHELPFLWDADFFRRRSPDGAEGYVLCEINASSVVPFPSEAPAAIAALVDQRLGGGVKHS